MTPVDCLVIGGGISGLAAAYQLAKEGATFLLLEKSSRAGGVILTEPVDGFTIDGGPDALLVQKPAAIELCDELGLSDRLVPTTPPRVAFVQRRGRLYPLPLGSVLGIPTRWGPFIRTGLFSLAGKARMGAELFVPARRDEADESIGSFMTRRFGREATEYLAEPLLAGIHSGDVDRLSIDALFPRFRAAERQYGSLLRAFRRTPRPAEDAGPFRSLPGGLSELVQALVHTLGEDRIRFGSEVARLSSRESAPGLFEVMTTSTSLFTARALILATPAYQSATVLRGFDDDLSQRCAEIEYQSTAAVALGFRRDDVAHSLNGSGFVVPRVESSGIFAASWLSSKWPHRAPRGRVLIRAFVGGARDPRALDESDASLVARSIDALRPIIGICAPPLLTRVYRWDKASPQHAVGHLARIAAIDRAVSRHPGLFVTGSGFRGVGIPDCIADGREAARSVAVWLRSGSTQSSQAQPVRAVR